VFTCLSHDIIAHETTHALLDGVHPRFNEPVNEDVLAFHEAFADIVALFQHFSYPGVLRESRSHAPAVISLGRAYSDSWRSSSHWPRDVAMLCAAILGRKTRRAIGRQLHPTRR
jgi:hypothetical protein